MPPPFVGPIEALFKVTPADAAALARDLYIRSVRAYERSLNAQLEALGHEGGFRLQNREELQRLRAQAVETARGIASTYNRELAARVDAIVEAEGARGLNRRTLARRLADWDAERAGPKAEQIQRTESRRIASQAVSRWVEASRLDDQARFRVVPAESSHDDPNDRAANSGELLTREEFDGLGLPAHPNERHSGVVALPTGTTIEAPWLGG